MRVQPPPRSFWLKWGVIFLCWTGFALFFTYQIYLYQLRAEGAIHLLAPLLTCLCWAYVWFAVTPLILYSIDRLPFDREHPIRGVAVHSLAAACIFCINSAIYVPLLWTVVGPDANNSSIATEIGHVIVTELHIGLVVYWIVFGIVRGLDYYLRYREGEVRAANLQTRLVRSQLDALRMQLHPHFLFNTLNSISVLMRRDVEAADRMLLQLSSLLRVTLASHESHEIRLEQELEILERYLEIEKIRFQDRLTVRMDVDPDSLDALVPHLFFQPLVENAIRHGIAEREAGGVVEIRAQRRDGIVRLQVRDNGPGLLLSPHGCGEGVGLSNLRSRLEHLYGAQASFEASDAEDGGAVVTAALPFHTTSVVDAGTRG
jgi:two-component system LytT family sensor kinase